MQKMQRGITKKTLMVLTAIIGVVCVIATTSYALFQRDISRSQVFEAVNLLFAARQPFSKYFSERRRWPDTPQQLLDNTSGKYTDSIAITSGAGAASGVLTITATMKASGIDSAVAGKTVQISTVDGKTWTCRAGITNGVRDKHLPAVCRP